jgi:ABC-type sugar transport system ATPase subunit
MKVDKGEIHGLVGKNGAGKSTFVNIITGLVDNYKGDVLLEGENINGESVFSRQKRGLFIVPQHMVIVNEFTVAENIFIGVWPKTKAKLIDWRSIYRIAEAVLKLYGLNIDPRQKASTLSLVDRRKLNIVRALFSNAKLIILDEPTTSLTKEERTNLFDFIKNLREKGTSFIFISHYLDEVLKLCDKITILRDGTAYSFDMSTEKNERELSTKMLGDSVELFYRKKVEDFEDSNKVPFTCKNLKAPHVHQISFELNKGDIVGFVGFLVPARGR